MKNQNFIILLIGAAIVIIVIYSLMGITGASEEHYIEEIEKHRTEYNVFLRNGGESPIKDAVHRKAFSGLEYFEIDSDYRVKASFEKAEVNQYIELGLNNNEKRRYQKKGHAVFTLGGQTQKLLVLQSMSPDDNELFIPFYDETSAFETYGGGRYVHPVILPNNKIEIDFNKAYNPYCAYNHEYVCPLPPAENKITVKVKAGEKKYDFPV
ncbi:MAG: DUF1684 domain-containing protein [Cyclobacteriaceae bacterium]|nr:DUF1684 domain-containing protein [Cyclobacteriaceae bacterium]